MDEYRAGLSDAEVTRSYRPMITRLLITSLTPEERQKLRVIRDAMDVRPSALSAGDLLWLNDLHGDCPAREAPPLAPGESARQVALPGSGAPDPGSATALPPG